MKNVVVVEDILKIGGEKGEEIFSQDSSFEGDIDDVFERGGYSVWNKIWQEIGSWRWSSG